MKTIKKIIKPLFLIALCALVVGALAVLIINFSVIAYADRYTISVEEASILTDVDCIMVLGCGVRGTSPTPLLADRLERGVEVYNSGASNKLLMSGDHGQDHYDEVNVMKNYALDNGVAEQDIFMDHAGFSTYESMYRAKAIFGVKKMIIVTQKYHLSRAVYIARKLGIEAYGVISDHRTFSGQFYRDCREVLARVKDVFTAIIQPKPTYLGPSIPISGDGMVTNG